MAKEYQDELKIDLEEKADAIIATLPDFSRKFFNDLKEQRSSPRTMLQYAYDMRRFFNFVGAQAGFKDKNMHAMRAADILDVLTLEDLQEYSDSLDYRNKLVKGKKRHTEDSTKARQISCLRSFYRYYYRIQEIKNLTADLLSVPSIPAKEIIALDKSDIERILKAISETSVEVGENTTHNIKKHVRDYKMLVKRDLAIMTVLLGTGIRVSELVGIDMQDIDFYEASLRVTRKGGDTDVVYFSDSVEEALLDYINNTRPALLGSKSDVDALFVSNRQTRISVRSVELLVKKLSQKAGLTEKITPHTMRKTYGTHLYEATGDLTLVADALHHASSETARRHYIFRGKEHKRKASKIAEDLFTKD